MAILGCLRHGQDLRQGGWLNFLLILAGTALALWLIPEARE